MPSQGAHFVLVMLKWQSTGAPTSGPREAMAADSYIILSVYHTILSILHRLTYLILLTTLQFAAVPIPTY